MMDIYYGRLPLVYRGPVVCLALGARTQHDVVRILSST